MKKPSNRIRKDNHFKYVDSKIKKFEEQPLAARKGCLTKTTYESPRIAQREALMVMEREGNLWTYYRCDFCSGRKYHLTNPFKEGGVRRFSMLNTESNKK